MRQHCFYPLLILMLLAGCGPGNEPSEDGTMEADWQAMADTTRPVAVVTGLSGPEAVRYDPDQDVYFIANFNGGGMDRDANGFISRVAPDGRVETLRFMEGTAEAPLHAPRGMFILADTLWAADVDGLHGFDRKSGAHVAFVDFTAQDPGFLNDLAAGPDGTLYVTDTGRSRVYRLQGRSVDVALEDTLLGPPNGIVWEAEHERLVFAPWGSRIFHAWQPGADTLEVVGESPGGRFDGIEVVDGRLLVASQVDSSLHVVEDGQGRPWLRVAGRPADLGIDTRRGRVAVPYIALDRVDIWDLPYLQGER